MFPSGTDGKESACSAGDPGSIPGSGRSPGGGNGSPLQYSCWRIPWTEEPGGLQSMGSKSQTGLRDQHQHIWGCGSSEDGQSYLSIQGRTQTSGQGAPGSWCSGPGVIIPLSKDTGNLRAASCGWTGRSNNGSTSPCCLWLLARSGRKEAPQPLLLPPALLPGPSRHSGQLSEGITE